MEFLNHIAQWQKELLSPSKDDVLVNVIENRNALLLKDVDFDEDQKMFLDENKLLLKLIKASQVIFKKSAVQTLGTSHCAIHYSFEGKEYLSPLIIKNIQAKRDRIRQKIKLNQVGDAYINPFLIKLFELDALDVSVELLLNELDKKGLKYTFYANDYIGNFHPHRFILLRDIERFSVQKELNFSLKELFGIGESDDFELDLTQQQIVFSDYQQTQAVETLKNKNTVLQGPPGTGKSDVIANVVTKSMASGCKSLLVAEQQTAINVIVDKLRHFELHFFCAKLHHNLSAKDFVLDLKDTWSFLENTELKFSSEVNRSYHMIQNLQLLLDKFNSNALFGGIDFGEFKRYCDQLNTSTIKYPNSLPEIQTWLSEKKQVASFLGRFKEDSKYLWTFLKIESNSNSNLLEEEILKVQKIIKVINWETNLISDFSDYNRLATYVHSFFYDDQLLDRRLFNSDNTRYKKFKKLYSELLQTSEEIEIFQNEKKNWKKELNESELFDFLEVIQHNDKFSLSNWIKKRELKKASKFDLKGTKKAIENLLYLKDLEKKASKIKADLRDLGLPDDLVSLTQINLLIQKGINIKSNVFQELIALSDDKLRNLYLSAQNIEEVAYFIKKRFYFLPKLSWCEFFIQFHLYKAELSGSAEQLEQISVTTKKMVYEVQKQDISIYDDIVFHSHWKYLTAKFPQLTSFDPSTLGKKLNDIIIQSKEDQIDFAQHIKNKIKTKFTEAHELLLTPARKLTEDEKKRKVRLRKGKSILVKQFAKSRNHLSPLELLSSEAAEWIQILKPLITGSSVSVAQNLPFKINYFDLVLFDEASQINLSHAVGSIFRAKRVLVAGDSQQMPPSNLFRQSKDSIDLLSQASYYWKNIHLEFHYRSHHPELITFSNKYFYNDKLRAFPYFDASFPIEVINLKGIYKDRVNEEEAEKVAKILKEKVSQHTFDFGLVAFSQKQLEAILSLLDTDTKNRILEKEDELLLSSLEHVQGEQCDHLIISMGYGINEEGKFLHQFGPLNKPGGHRRLNVLMSRARKKITFLRSVNESDFKISENDGVDMLRRLMVYLSTVSEREKDRGINSLKNKTYLFSSFYHKIPEAHNLVSMHNVLTERNWEVKYTF